jgi:hypothetical protein
MPFGALPVFLNSQCSSVFRLIVCHPFCASILSVMAGGMKTLSVVDIDVDGSRQQRERLPTFFG